MKEIWMGWHNEVIEIGIGFPFLMHFHDIGHRVARRFYVRSVLTSLKLDSTS
ncbi:MAG: hypothetical protein ACI90V_008990 [Bacillariaceae sp.]|jgi:hypothetical protein